MHLLFYVTVYRWTSAHIKQVIMCRVLKVWKHNIHTLLASLPQLTGKKESEVVNQTISDPKVKVGVATPPHNQARRCHTGFCANAANMQCTYSPLWAICSATLCWSNRYRPSAVHERESRLWVKHCPRSCFYSAPPHASSVSVTTVTNLFRSKSKDWFLYIISSTPFIIDMSAYCWCYIHGYRYIHIQIHRSKCSVLNQLFLN